jgi:hypothetical protein
MEGRLVAQAICRSQSEGTPDRRGQRTSWLRLADLRDQGMIDVEESGREKAKVLAA